ncbi:MAG: heme ABC transporter ATP-binding protein [Arthrobacter sp.]
MSDAVERIVELESVSFRIGQRDLLREVCFSLDRSSLVALVGPNGAGKSTLLSLIAGDQEPTEGTVRVAGTEPRRWKAKDFARQRAVMLQEHRVGFSFSVEETVAMGRLPYPVSEGHDAAMVRQAITRTGLTRLKRQDVTTLSGGESSRSSYARVLAQAPPLILLDEPTAALDLQHQESVMRSSREHADDGHCVVAVLHDLNLASRYADRVIVIADGRITADGPPETVLTVELIEEVYGQKVCLLRHPASQALVIVPA